MWRTVARSPSFCAPTRASIGSITAGFPDSPFYPLTQKYLGGRASSLFTFGVKGGLEAGKTFYDALKLIKRLVNIGDAKSLCCHPASTTHRQMTARAAIGGRAFGPRRSGSASASNIATTLSRISTRRLGRRRRARLRPAPRLRRSKRDAGRQSSGSMRRRGTRFGGVRRAAARGAGRSARPRQADRDRACQQYARCGACGDRAPVLRSSCGGGRANGGAAASLRLAPGAALGADARRQ